MIPVRCFTCGKVIAHKWKHYEIHLELGHRREVALAKLNMERYCCRRMFLTHVNLVDKLIQFPDNTEKPSGENSEKNLEE